MKRIAVREKIKMQDTKSLWGFAVERYERDGVKDACLHLQDTYGVDIPVLLFLLWIHESFTGEKGELGRFCKAAIDEVKDWQQGVVQPLRAARRAVKGDAKVGSTEYYETAKRVELEAEKRQLLHLQIMADGHLNRLALGESNSDAVRDELIWSYFEGLGVEKGSEQGFEANRLLDDILIIKKK